MGYYDGAQLCINGHLITEYAHSNPSSKKPFCAKCGAATTTTCPNGHDIKGAYQSDMPILGADFSYDRPAYCEQCGVPYPWTSASIEAANELIQLSEQLNDTEKEDFKKSIPDLVSESPKTKVAQAKFATYAKKMGKEAASGVKDVLVEIVSETVKKAIWGQ